MTRSIGVLNAVDDSRHCMIIATLSKWWITVLSSLFNYFDHIVNKDKIHIKKKKTTNLCDDLSQEVIIILCIWCSLWETFDSTQSHRAFNHFKLIKLRLTLLSFIAKLCVMLLPETGNILRLGHREGKLHSNQIKIYFSSLKITLAFWTYFLGF